MYFSQCLEGTKQVLPDILGPDGVQHILPLVRKVADEIISKELEILNFSADLDPVAHIPHLWKADIPVGLCKLLYKHVSSCLPIGQTWHSSLSLGQFC